MTNEFTGYVLAGGRSSRMGTDKAFLKIGEKTFLENSIGILAPVCGKIKVVLNKHQNSFPEKLPGGVPHIFDRFENRGALGGIHAAFSDCQTAYAAVLAVDLPFVTSEALKKLCEIVSAEKDLSAVVPRQTDGRFQPLCAVYRAKKCVAEAEDILLKTDSASMRLFLERVNAEIVEAENFDADQNLFSNINDPNEYENFLKNLD